ncbi:MAG: hypothetical protein J6D46_07685 [Lachnospiraceae bacterium]|nr:hypothetical protein [Lachnospiraceae bacterium]
MRSYEYGEYDNYTYPEPLKEETPETRKKLKEAKDKVKDMIARHCREAEKMDKTDK